MPFRTLIVLITSLMIAGCGTLSSSSMRIHVDVYKGPLANTKSIQKAQLKEILNTAKLALKDMKAQLEASKAILDCKQVSKVISEGYSGEQLNFNIELYPENKSIEEERNKLGYLNYRVCPVYERMLLQVEKLLCKTEKYEVAINQLLSMDICDDSDARCKDLVQNAHNNLVALTYNSALSAARQAETDDAAYGKVAEIATGFRVLATYLSYQLASVEPPHMRLKIDMAKLANFAAEYANQLTSRANALALQTGAAAEPGLNRRNLSTGQYLRDTQPTAFIDVYDWFGAGVRGSIPTSQRIGIAKRLFDDDNWARINEVYASGIGKTSMAFIKDDIGNWNLKSFENDPSELVAAYTELTGDLIEKAASLASGGTTDVVRQANELIKASQLTQTGAPPEDLRAGRLIGSLDIRKTRKTYQDKIDQIKDSTLFEVNKIEEIQNEELTTKEEKVQELTKKGAGKIAAVVDEYSALIEALQRVAVIDSKE